MDLEPWDLVVKLSNGSTGNGNGHFRTGNQLISAGNGPKTVEIAHNWHYLSCNSGSGGPRALGHGM